MKIKSLLLSISFLLATLANAQTQFQKTAGSSANDRNYQIATLRDGSLVATGYTAAFSSNKDDAYLIKYNRFGEVDWAKAYGDSEDDYSWDLLVTKNNEIVGCGLTNSFGTPYAAATLTKTDSNGKVLWFTGAYSTSGNLEFYRITETSTGHILATGLAGTSKKKDDIILCKFTPKGQLLWTRLIGSNASDEAMGIMETSEGNYLLAGVTNDANGNGSSDFAAVKTDSAGNVIWKKRYGGNNGERLNSVIEINNSYYFCGWSSSDGNGEDDIFLMNTDTAGNVNWIKSYGSNRNELCFNIMMDVNGSDTSLLLTGYTEKFSSQGSSNNRNTYLLKVNLKGNMIWARSYGSSDRDGHWPTGIAKNDDAGYYLFASTNSFGSGDYDLYLIKTDTAGNTGCHQKDPSFNSKTVTGWKGADFGRDSVVHYFTGTATITGTNWKISAKSQCCSLYSKVSGDDTLCMGDTATLTSASLPGYAYTWSLGGSTVSKNPVLEVPYGNEGYYNLEVVGVNSKCSSVYDTVTIVDDTMPDLGFNSSYEFCEGDSIHLMTNATLDSLVWASFVQKKVVNRGNTYTVYNSDTFFLGIFSTNGCYYQDILYANSLDVPAFSLGKDTDICDGESVNLQASSMYDFKWLHDTLLTNSIITADTSGTYILQQINGICSFIDSIDIMVNPLPTVSLGADAIICPDSFSVVKPSGMFDQINWSDGSQADSLVINTSDTIWAKVSTSKGCFAYDTVVIKVINVPDSIFAMDTVHFTNTYQLDAGAGWASYKWNDGSTNQTLTISKEGWYSIEVVSSQGCKVVDSIYATMTTSIKDYNRQFRIYPNPAQYFLVIESIGNQASSLTITLTDLAGREQISRHLDGEINSYKLNLEPVKPGLYLLQISNGKQQSSHLLMKR